MFRRFGKMGASASSTSNEAASSVPDVTPDIPDTPPENEDGVENPAPDENLNDANS